MKQLLILFFALVQTIACAQAKLGMSKVYSFSPSDTVPFNANVGLSVYIKNKGNAAFTGTVSISAKRDFSNGVMCDSNTFFVSTLQPNDSILTSLNFVPTSGPTAFQVAGNGNTIIVWPFAGSTIVTDSLRSVLWIEDVTGLNEMDKGAFMLFPNPATNTIIIKANNRDIYKKIIIYDVFARKIKEMDFEESIDVSDLKPGTYCIIIRSEEKIYKTRIIKK